MVITQRKKKSLQFWEEKRRNQMEDEYKNNVQHSLKAIIKKLNEK